MTIRYHSTNPTAPTLTNDFVDMNAPWRERASCYGAAEDPIMQDAWVDEESQLKESARAICFSCPVREQCLRDAAIDSEAIGIRAGFEFEDGKVDYRDQQTIKKEFNITVKARRNVVSKARKAAVERELRDAL